MPIALYPAPDDFATVCLTQYKVGLEKHYGVCRHTVSRWLKTISPETAERRKANMAEVRRTALTASSRQRALVKLRPMPEDFADVAPTLTATGLENHYRTGNKAVRRWLAQLPDGVTCLSRAMAKPKPARFTKGVRTGGHMKPAFESETNRSTAQLAALHLQRRFAPVCSATIVDPAAKGQWIVGRRTMPEADMLAFAERQGWRRDAWQDLRA